MGKSLTFFKTPMPVHAKAKYLITVSISPFGALIFASLSFPITQKMGVQGTLEYFSILLSKLKRRKKLKQIQTVALKVRMDCEGCERKMKSVLSSVKGVKSVDVDLKQQKVTVSGYIEGKKVLKAAKKTKKKVEMWPYVPYTIVANPYVSQAYDKKAPPNMVRSLPDSVAITETTMDDHYTTLFSDENPNSCSIM